MTEISLFFDIEMLVVAFVIVLLLLLALLVKETTKLDGGEYLKYKSKYREAILSPSQIYLNSLQEYSFKDDMCVHIHNSANQIRKDILNMHANIEYFRIDAGKGRLFSDANIDLEIAKAVFEPTAGFGVCELESEILHRGVTVTPTYGNNILSYIDDDKVKHDIASKYKIDANKLRHANKQIFLEFSYKGDDIDIFTAYENIHKATKHIFNDIKKRITDGKQMFIYKVFVAEDGTVSYKNMSVVAKGTINGYKAMAAYGKEWQLQQEKIMVPATEYSFGMDEFIYLETAIGNFSIQIEHSENLRLHKSNMIEFILRIANNGSYVNLNSIAKMQNRSLGLKKYYELKSRYEVSLQIDSTHIEERRAKDKAKFEAEETRVKSVFQSINDRAPEDAATYDFIRKLNYNINILDNRFLLGYTSDNPNKDGSIHLTSPIVTAYPAFAARYFHKFSI